MHTSSHARPLWQTAIHELAAIERPSASDGERRAAELVAGRLGQLGCEVSVEQELAHGGYWLPIGLLNGLAAGAGLLALRRGGRLERALAALAASACATALWDDLAHARRWFRRAALRYRPTWNVVARAGDPDGRRTVVFVGHHDAAHSGLVFHPALGRIGPRVAPRLHARSSHTFPILYAVWLGPVAIAAGAVVGNRRLLKTGMVLAIGAAEAMTDIGRRSVVPGANDNLSAVGALIALGAGLRDRPVQGVRVLLVSTGSEESFSEGMEAFIARHRDELDPDSTEIVCLECLGGSTLIVLEGEGMLRMRDYHPSMREALARAAEVAGVGITRGLRTVAATDALIAMRDGYRVATLASVEDTKLPRNYHWPSDVPEALRWETIEDAIGVCDSFLRARSQEASLGRQNRSQGDVTEWDASASSSTSEHSERRLS